MLFLEQNLTVVIIELYHRAVLKVTKGGKFKQRNQRIKGRISNILIEDQIVEIVTLGKNHRLC